MVTGKDNTKSEKIILKAAVIGACCAIVLNKIVEVLVKQFETDWHSYTLQTQNTETQPVKLHLIRGDQAEKP